MTRVRAALGATCTALGILLIILALGLTAVGLYGIWKEEGFGGVEWALSPFNVINFIVTLLSLAPGVGFMLLGARISEGKPE